MGHRLVESGRSVIFAPAYRLVQDLLAAKRDFGPAASTTQAPAWPNNAVKGGAEPAKLIDAHRQ